MAKNLLVINVDIRETRVALIENGIIAELHIERETSRGTLGNIYLGKVSRVLPGMQAAFIDVGLERAAFLHVEDLIRPDDFEAYLAGHRRGGAAAATDEDRASGPSAEDAANEEMALAPRTREPSEPPPAQPEAAEPIEADAELEREADIELPPRSMSPTPHTTRPTKKKTSATATIASRTRRRPATRTTIAPKPTTRIAPKPTTRIAATRRPPTRFLPTTRPSRPAP